MKYSELVYWYDAGKLEKSERENLVSGTILNLTSSADRKVPAFKVPTFHDNTLKGDKFIKKVKHVFINSTMVVFINNRKYCDNHPAWSAAFASYLRDLITNSNILGYLAMELDTEENCADIWKIIKDKLSSVDVTTSRIYRYWQDLFGLKCEDMDSFIHF